MKTYRRITFLLGLVLFLILSGGTLAKGKEPVRFKDIEQLYFILQHLDGEELVLIKPEKNCFCGCWELSWACTDDRCPEQGRSCENPPPEPSKNAR